MNAIGSVFGRLPAAVFAIVGLLIGPRLLQAGGIGPAQVGLFVGGSILLDIQYLTALAPYLVALPVLLGIVFLLAHHHTLATIAAGVAVFFLLGDFAWSAWLSSWAIPHLTGAA